jgi:hypothetical protein
MKNPALRNMILVMGIHLCMVLISLLPGIRGMELQESLTQSDQGSYINNAYRLIESGKFTREAAEPFLWEPYRTPGLPVIIAFSLMIFNSLIPVLFINVLFAGLAAYFGTKLLQLFAVSDKVLIYYGWLLALMPNIVGTDCYVLTDSIFSYLGIMWMYFVIRTTKFHQYRDVFFASLCVCYAQLTKPTLSIAIVLLLIILPLLYWNRWKQIPVKQTMLLIALSLIGPLYLSYQMYRSHGVFTPTLLGEETRREYLIANYLSARTGEDYYTIQQQIRADDKLAVNAMPLNHKTYYGNLFAYKKAKSDSIVKADPAGVGKAFLLESIKQVFAPQEIIFQVFSRETPKVLRLIGALLNIIFFTLIIAGCYSLYKRRLYSYILIIGLFYGFYIASGSLSSRQGGRFRLPADALALPVAAVGLHVLLSRISKQGRDDQAGLNIS